MPVLARRDPFLDDFTRLARTLLGPTPAERERLVPPMDVIEKDDHFAIRMDIPGVKDEDVSCEVENDTLTVSGERREESEEREGGAYRLERSFGRFSRRFDLPRGIDPDQIEGSVEGGVLELRIPKPEQPSPRRIQIGRREGQREVEAGGEAREKGEGGENG